MARTFLWKVRDRCVFGLARRVASSYFESRRGTEPPRARPLRCEAAPPTKKGPRTGRSGFLKRPGSASLYFSGERLDSLLQSILGGRQASTWSAREDGGESRSRAAS